MPKRISKKSSTSRRHQTADDIKSGGWVTMRSCLGCLQHNVPCVVSDFSDSCERCYRFNRCCELSSPSSEIARLSREADKLDEQILAERTKSIEAEAKSFRLRKQRRLLTKKLRDLGDREAQNIAELEKDEEELEKEKANAIAKSVSDRHSGSGAPGHQSQLDDRTVASSSGSGDPLSPSFLQSLGSADWGFLSETVEPGPGTS
jgi:hypothetical protein